MPILDEKDLERMKSRQYSMAAYPEDSMFAKVMTDAKTPGRIDSNNMFKV